MATQFGYKPNQFGYLTAPRQPPSPAPKPLALAAAGTATPANPFGLAAAAAAPKVAQFNAPVGGAATGPAPGAQPAQPPKPANVPAGQMPTVQPTQPNAAPTPGYDLNTDSALQTSNSFLGMNDQQAQASALKQRQDLLLGYGDPQLVRQYLGDETLAQAAANNPTSTLHTLGQQRDKYLTDLTDFHNGNNTFYGGSRILDEQNAGTDYQNALAQAAAQANSGLGGIDSSLNATLGANQQSRIQALTDAENRALQAALASGYTSDVPAAPAADAAASDNTGAVAPQGGSPLSQILGEFNQPATGNPMAAQIALNTLGLQQEMAGNPLAPAATKKQTAGARSALDALARSLAR